MLYEMRKLSLSRKSKKFNLEAVAPNYSSSEFEANNWELSELVMQKLVPVIGVHPFPLNELLLMAGAVARRSKQRLKSRHRGPFNRFAR
jgi:hypothetical protein